MLHGNGHTDGWLAQPGAGRGSSPLDPRVQPGLIISSGHRYATTAAFALAVVHWVGNGGGCMLHANSPMAARIGRYHKTNQPLG